MRLCQQLSEEAYAEVISLQERTTNARLLLKLQVLQLRMQGYKNAEIAAITRYSASRVSALVCIYAKQGIGYFAQENRPGGNRRNLSLQEEAAFLQGYEAAASKGRVITTEEMAVAYEALVGHPIGSGQIYKVLKRHGFRKVMPRSRHPQKASDEAIAASKKLTFGWTK